MRGSREALVRHPKLRAAPGRLVVTSREPCIPWGGFRALLAEFHVLHGEAPVLETIEGRRGPLSLVLRGLTSSLDEAERAARRRAGAALLGFLSHNAAARRELDDACIGVTVALLRRAPLEIAVPDALGLDEESIALLRAVARALDGDAPLIVLGEDTEPASPEGGLWQRRLVVNTGHLALIEALATTEVLEGGSASEGAAPPPPLEEHPLDDGLERDADAALRAGLADRDGALRVLEAVRAAFASFGYEAVLRLGLGLLAARPDPLTLRERAEVHLRVALAAYNRQVQTAGDPTLVDFLDEHFRAALALEDDPAQRSHLLYRLTINQGRRRGSVEDALALADASVAAAEEARATAPGLSAFTEAWARNGRAYVLARMKRIDAGIRDCERAFELLGGLDQDPTVPLHEARFSPLVIADNLAELHARARDHAGARRWQAKLAELEQREFGRALVAHRRAMVLDMDDIELAGAEESARRGFEDARDAWDPLGEDYYAAALGDLQYRRGDAEGALASLHHALVIRRRVGLSEDVRAMEIASALASLRARRWDRAGEHLERAVELVPEGALAFHAQLRALEALLAASLGAPERADARMNEAIALAVEAGERDALVRVARLVGDTCHTLGREGDAREAWGRALEIAAGGGEGAPPAPADEVFLVHARLWVVAGGQEHLEAALGLLPEALGEPEPWWVLGEVVAAAEGRGVAPELREGVGRARGWLEQRVQ